MVKLAVLSFGMVLAVPASSEMKVFLEPAETNVKVNMLGRFLIQADYSSELEASISKLVPEVQLVADANAAAAVLQHTAMEERSTARAEVFGRDVAAPASAQLTDACGSIVWSTFATGRSRWRRPKLVGRDPAIPRRSDVTDQIANRLRAAVRRGRVNPCQQF